jgi:lipopolysaccharide export system protein LptA
MRWQKIARVTVAAIGLAGAVAIYYYSRSRSAPADPPKSLAKLDSNVVQTADDCHMILLRAKGNVKIDCATMETFSDGRQLLKQAVVTGLNGSAFVLRGDSLEKTGQQSTQGLPFTRIVVTGHVKMTTDDGLELLGDQATYDDEAGQFVMPGPVTFTKGRMSGAAVGATYERDTDTIKLLDKASARVGADPSGKGTANATATRMSLKRGQHTLVMEGGVRVVGDTQTMTGNDATWTFTENEQAVKYVELRGAARVFPNVRGSTDQATMNGDNITMTFGPDGLTLQHATLTGSAGLEMAGSASRTIRASLIDFFLGADGRLVTKLDANDQVTVTLAATPTAAGRTITAATLAATGDNTKGLTRAQFDGNPVFRQDAAAVPARGAASGSTTGKGRVGSATRLVLTLGGQIDAIQFAEFQQHAKFDDADMHGEGDIAKYDEANQRLYLIPNDRDPAPDIARQDGRHGGHRLDD